MDAANVSFDFLNQLDAYAKHGSIKRLDHRYEGLIRPHLDLISDGRVLDLAAHDGRWSYAFARSGAKSVTGVEARPELIDRFRQFPDDEFKARVQLLEADLFDYLDVAVFEKERFDVVAVFGVLYHVMDHYRLLAKIRQLRPKVIIVDSVFMLSDEAIINVVMEETDNPLNAIRQFPGQTKSVKGTPSKKALEKMAKSLDYKVRWFDWTTLEKHQRVGMNAYFESDKKTRATCALVPTNRRPPPA